VHRIVSSQLVFDFWRYYQVQEEESLIHRIQKGDNEAFNQIYENYFDRIYRYIVFKTGNSYDAEDLTQQVFIKAFKAIPKFKWRGLPFSAWLFRIAHNQIIDYLRKEMKQSTLRLSEPTITSKSNPVTTLERKFDIQRLNVAIRQLTEAQQQVLSLRFAGEMPVIEVAKTMGKKPGAIKALQHSAILSLRKKLSVVK
jgi:RNA polymerase sigma-70 factor (ECF subfamily)